MNLFQISLRARDFLAPFVERYKRNSTTLAVVVGRFQIDELTQGHRAFLRHVSSKFKNVLVLIGDTPKRGCPEDPIPAEYRKQMIEDEFPNVFTRVIQDRSTDEAWSEQLDAVIAEYRRVLGVVTAQLWGSRDSFARCYTTKRYYIQEYQSPCPQISASESRKEIGRLTRINRDIRRGLILQTQRTYPVCYTTVDVAIMNEDETEVLLGRKEGESLFRFIGGFSEPTSENFEQDCRRESAEETGVAVDDFKYIASALVTDYRYKRGPSKIKTLFFKGRYIYGAAKAGDDIEEVRWFKVADVKPENIVKGHRVLWEILQTHLTLAE